MSRLLHLPPRQIFSLMHLRPLPLLIRLWSRYDDDDNDVDDDDDDDDDHDDHDDDV